ncbi:MAG: hypothetical protein FWF10_11365 [Clostridiales bacterium]|nr:hypothetical protein [Clostridiales bacterium]
MQNSNVVELTSGGLSNKNWVNVKPGSFSDGDVVFVSADSSVATITSGTKTYGALWYEITPISSGRTVVYAQTADGSVKSGEITVYVDRIKSLEMYISGTQTLTIGGLLDGSFKSWVKVNPMQYNADLIEFVSADESVAIIAKGTDALAGLWFEVLPVAPGTTTVFARTIDGEVISDALTIIVKG